LRPQDLDTGSLLDGVQHAVVVVEVSTGRIAFWNPKASEVFGYSQAEAVHMDAERLVPRPHKARYRAELSRYRETGDAPYTSSGEVLDLPAVRKSGEEIRVELTLSPVESRSEAGPLGRYVMAVVRDVTERRKADEEIRRLNEELGVQVAATGARLRESEERFRLVVESLRDYAIFIVDPDGRIVDWNVGAERIFGYRSEEIVGKDFSTIFTPEDAGRGVPEWELMQAMSEGRAEDERWHMRKDGSRFWASGILYGMRPTTSAASPRWRATSPGASSPLRRYRRARRSSGPPSSARLWA
jgi:PAS domain S-box-containing protein